MNIVELEKLKDRQEREARKWVGYLETVPDRKEREKELTRKLTEVWLEGRASGRGEPPAPPVPTLEDAKKRFHAEIVSKAETVDPEQECDWSDLAYGFLIALGFPPGEETRAASRELEDP